MSEKESISYEEKLEILNSLEEECGVRWYSEGLEYINNWVDTKGIDNVKSLIDGMWEDFLENVSAGNIEICVEGEE